MKNELQQGNMLRKNSGRYNTADTGGQMNLPSGAGRKRPSFDDLSMGQFVIGFLNNIMDTQYQELVRHMMVELNKTIKLAENLSWPIARGAFAASMHKIEDRILVWSNSRQLADSRLTYSQSAFFSGSVTMSPRPGTPAQNNGGSTRRIVCKWFNAGSCPHSGDHMDATGVTTFRHICMFCYRNLKRNNAHTEIDCKNKKKPVE